MKERLERFCFFFWVGEGAGSGQVEVIMKGMATGAGSCQGLWCINLVSLEGRAHVSE